MHGKNIKVTFIKLRLQRSSFAEIKCTISVTRKHMHFILDCPAQHTKILLLYYVGIPTMGLPSLSHG